MNLETEIHIKQFRKTSFQTFGWSKVKKIGRGRSKVWWELYGRYGRKKLRWLYGKGNNELFFSETRSIRNRLRNNLHSVDRHGLTYSSAHITNHQIFFQIDFDSRVRISKNFFALKPRRIIVSRIYRFSSRPTKTAISRGTTYLMHAVFTFKMRGGGEKKALTQKDTFQKREREREKKLNPFNPSSRLNFRRLLIIQ